MTAEKANPRASKASGYIPSLDGWRALAVLAVISVHDTVHRAGPVSTAVLNREGHRGVNLFFAISGILICSRLLEERTPLWKNQPAPFLHPARLPYSAGCHALSSRSRHHGAYAQVAAHPWSLSQRRSLFQNYYPFTAASTMPPNSQITSGHSLWKSTLFALPHVSGSLCETPRRDPSCYRRAVGRLERNRERYTRFAVRPGARLAHRCFVERNPHPRSHCHPALDAQHSAKCNKGGFIHGQR